MALRLVSCFGHGVISYPLVPGQKINVGRHPRDCQLVVPAVQTSVGHHHCNLFVCHDYVRVQDRGSQHGAYINGLNQCQPGILEKLNIGDTLDLGKSAAGMRFRLDYVEPDETESVSSLGSSTIVFGPHLVTTDG